MVLTPFGAGFYFTLAQEYLDFQLFSPYLMQNQERIQPGPLVELETRLGLLQQAIPDEWKSRWNAVLRQILSFGACTDFRGSRPVNTRVVRDPTIHPRFLGGRAVIASLAWIIWTLKGDEELPELLCQYVAALYPSDENYDYRFFLDIAAAWMGCSNIEEAFRKHDPETIRNILFAVDSAAWFGLHAGPKLINGGQAVQEN